MTFTDLRILQCARGCIIEFGETLGDMANAENGYFFSETLLDRKKFNHFCE